MANIKTSYRRKNLLISILKYTLLSIGGIIMLFPYLWMLSTSLKAPGTWYNLSLLPEQISLQHYVRLISAGLLPRWYLNSIIIATISTISVAFFSSLTGYTFAKYQFWGKDLMFVIILSAIMIPTEMLIIPWYVGIAKLKWIDS
jgi:multiple sugar transport system permease protein